MSLSAFPINTIDMRNIIQCRYYSDDRDIVQSDHIVINDHNLGHFFVLYKLYPELKYQMKIFHPDFQNGKWDNITINNYIQMTHVIEPIFKLNKSVLKSCIKIETSHKGNYKLFIVGQIYGPSHSLPLYSYQNHYNNMYLTQIHIIKYQLTSVNISQPNICIKDKQFRLIDNTTINNKWYGVFCYVGNNHKTTMYYGTRQSDDKYNYISKSELNIQTMFDEPDFFHMEMVSEYLLIRTKMTEIEMYRFNHLKGSLKKLKIITINNFIMPRFSMFIISGSILIHNIGSNGNPMELDLYSISNNSFTKAFVNVNQTFVFPTTNKNLEGLQFADWTLYQTRCIDKVQDELLIFGYITHLNCSTMSIPYSIKKIICSYYCKEKISFIFYNFDTYKCVYKHPLHLFCWSFNVDKLYT